MRFQLINWLKVAGFLVLGAAVLGGLAIALGAVPPPWERQEQGDMEGEPRTALGVELVPGYTVTDMSLTCLRAWKVPEPVLAKLTGLKDRPFSAQQSFVQELSQILEPGQVKRYQDLVLYFAQSHTLKVPIDVRIALGIRKGKTELARPVQIPEKTTPLFLPGSARVDPPRLQLVMPGSTSLDPARLLRLRARFAPAELIEIAQVVEVTGKGTKPRELRTEDRVKQGDLLGVFYSDVVGNKKNDLVDAILQMALDQKILKRAEANAGSLPEVFILNAQRNVQGDLNAINRAMSTLKTWVVPEKDIENLVGKRILQAIKGEASWDIPDKDVDALKDKAKDTSQWGRIELRSPRDGVLIERNVALRELVQDPTVNLFQIAKVDQLTVLANVPEDDLPKLHQLRDELARRGETKIPWTVETVGSKPIAGYIDDIGYLIDPNQHTAVVKGHIDNPKELLRAGQFIKATVELMPPDTVVAVPMDALVEDGQQAIVFVQDRRHKDQYTMRRVEVTKRFEKWAFVKNRDEQIQHPRTPKDREKELEQGLLPKQALHAGEIVLLRGAVELKAALLDKESQRSAEQSDKGK
jgi:cobalt-zinc-cadmium efflux system membrane fusion protein